MAKKKERIDKLLVEWGLAPSRAKAQELIAERAVQGLENPGREDSAWLTITSPAHLVSTADRGQIRLLENEVLEFVSRGGRKLDHALRRLGLELEGARVLDVGQSTGGFTDCVLRHGAKLVVGLDVGEDQLHPRLLAEPRVQAFQSINVRNLHLEMNENSRLLAALRLPFDLIVMDLSFISLTQVLNEISNCLTNSNSLLALVKPQFELERRALNKKGVVMDEGLHVEVQRKIEASLLASGWQTQSYFRCELKGQDGNQEFFVYATRFKK